MSGREVDIGGEVPIFKYILESKFLTGQRQVVSFTLRSGVRKCGTVLEQMDLCVVLAVGPLPPYVHLVST